MGRDFKLGYNLDHCLDQGSRKKLWYFVLAQIETPLSRGPERRRKQEVDVNSFSDSRILYFKY